MFTKKINMNAMSTGDQVAIAGDGDLPVIRVYAMKIRLGSGQTVTYKGGAVALTGPMSYALNDDDTWPFLGNGEPWFTIENGEDFIFNKLAGQVSGVIVYGQAAA